MDAQDLSSVMSRGPEEVPLGETEKPRRRRWRDDDVEKERSRSPRRRKRRRREQEDWRTRDDDGTTPIPDMPEEIDPIPKRNVILQIRCWAHWFPHVEALQAMLADKDLENMEKPALDSLLKEVKHVVGQHGSGGMFEWAPTAFLQAYEELVCNLTPIDCRGITALSRDKAFRDACTEICLEYTNMTYMPPWARISLMVANTTYLLHNENSKHNVPAGGQEKSSQPPSGNRESVLDEMSKGVPGAKEGP
jgi:hypothetical protein